MPQGQVIAGTDGKIEIAGLAMWLDTFKIDPSAGDVKSTTFEDQACEDGTTGVISCAVSCSGYWDLNQNPHANPPGLRAGRILTNVRIYVSRSTPWYFRFPLFRLLRVPVNNQVEDRVNFEFSGRSKRIWYYPGGGACNV